MDVKQPEVLGVRTSFEEDYTDSCEGTQLVIKREQFIPDDYISDLKKDKIDSLHTPAGDFYRVGTIPEALVLKWGMEYCMNAPVREVLARMKKEQFDAFVLTNKRI